MITGDRKGWQEGELIVTLQRQFEEACAVCISSDKNVFQKGYLL
jgi:hypothetical protein